MGIADKAKDAIHSESVEQKSDAILDKVEEIAHKKLGADKADKISKVRDVIDEKIGNEGNERGGASTAAPRA
ncbi:MAG: Rv0909 family putative TA system antitoxin [Actinomycetaceae bacterium]|nr:Rv0909 family putative TA system antitoxin [Actinomycetaceae bacterium]